MPYLVRSNVLCSGQVNKYFAYDESEIDQVRNCQVERVDGSMEEARAEAERLNAEMRRDYSDDVAFG